MLDIQQVLEKYPVAMSAHPLADPRISRTRAALESALLELLCDHDLAQITVRHITQRAGVNRSTFYEHYASVDDLASSAGETLFDRLIAAAPVVGARHGDTDDNQAVSALASLFAHVADHANLYRALVGDGGSAHVVNHIHQRLTIATHVNLTHPENSQDETHEADPTEIPQDYPAAFLSGALLGTILDWLRRDCPGTPQEMSAAIWPLLQAAATAAA